MIAFVILAFFDLAAAGADTADTQKRVDELIQILADRDAEDTARGEQAIAELARIGEPAAAKLIALFADQEAQGEKLHQTNQAIAALAAIGKPAVPKLLDAVLDDRNHPPNTYNGLGIAWCCGRALEDIGKDALESVRARWAGLSELDRWKLMSFCGKFDYDAVRDFAVKSLASEDDSVRLQAIRFVGQHKEAKARGVLVSRLDSEEPPLRWPIVQSLAEIGGEEAVDALIPLLGPDSWAARGEGLLQKGQRWPDGRPHIIAGLRKLNARRAAAPLLVKLLQEKGAGRAYLGVGYNRQTEGMIPYRGAFIIPLLAEWQCKEAIPELRRILATDANELAHPESSWQTQIQTAAALWQLGDRSGRVLLIQRSQWETLCRFGDRADVPILIRCLSPRNSGFLRVCEGLERITGALRRSPGQSKWTIADVPRWHAWYENHRRELSNKERSWDLSALPGAKPNKASLPPERLESFWSDLAGINGPRAYRAFLALSATPEQTVRLLRERLQPVPVIDATGIARLIKDLDSNAFAERKQAAETLERIVDVVEPDLRKALADQPSPETGRRLETLIKKSERMFRDPEALRQVWAVAILEEIGTREAARVLFGLAKGAPAACLTQEAAAALDRLTNAMR